MSRKSKRPSVPAQVSHRPEVTDCIEPAEAEAAPEPEVLAEGSGPLAIDESASEATIEATIEATEPAVEPCELDGAEPAQDSVALPTLGAAMDGVQLKQLIEALVFAADKPMTVLRLRQLTRVGDTARIEHALAELADDYRERGLVLHQVSGGYQFRTRTQWAPWVQQLIAGRPMRLSRAQLETLAIIAYRQPITRPEIDDIRGVDSSATLKLLIDRSLIRILGKKEEVGRPMLYGTTREFLDFFSLGDLRELPTLREYSELTDESRQVISARLGVSLDDGEGEGEGGASGGGRSCGGPLDADAEEPAEHANEAGLSDLADAAAAFAEAAQPDEAARVDPFASTVAGNPPTEPLADEVDVVFAEQEPWPAEFGSADPGALAEETSEHPSEAEY